jgi:hypothetical protein
MFDLYQLKSCSIRYLPAVGTTVAGTIIGGIDYDPTDLPSTQAGVQALSNVLRNPVWDSSASRVDVSRAQKARNMFTANSGGSHPDLQKAFALCLWNSGPDSCGQIYVDYVIDFSSPASSQTVSGGGIVLGTAVYNSANTNNLSVLNAPSDSGQQIISGAGQVVQFNDWNIASPSPSPPPLFTSLPYLIGTPQIPLLSRNVYQIMINALIPALTGTVGAAFNLFNGAGISPELHLSSTDLILPGETQFLGSHNDPATSTVMASSQYAFRFQPTRDYAAGEYHIAIPAYIKRLAYLVGLNIDLGVSISTLGAAVAFLTANGVQQ